VVKRIIPLALLLFLGANWALAQGQVADPLRPLVGDATSVAGETAPAAQKQPLELRLEAVLLSPARAVAIINGQSLQVGDRIADYRLCKIESGSVELQNGQKKLVLRREGTGLKKAFSSQDVGKGSQL